MFSFLNRNHFPKPRVPNGYITGIDRLSYGNLTDGRDSLPDCHENLRLCRETYKRVSTQFYRWSRELCYKNSMNGHEKLKRVLQELKG